MPPPANSCVAAVSESPPQLLPAFTPKRLLLLVPEELLGMLRPQLLSSAAWATTLKGCTPSCCAAASACGQSVRTNCVFSAVVAGGVVLVVTGVAAAETVAALAAGATGAGLAAPRSCFISMSA